MRVPRALLLAVAAAALAVPAAIGSSTPPGGEYAWAQPGCAVVSTPYAQPPAWIPIIAAQAPPVVPGSDYVWPQPGGPLLSVPCAQPVAATS